MVFWWKVRIGDGCWEWQAARDRRGYGLIRFRGALHRAHRVSWALAHGELPTACVLHRCDNRSCVRPEHLFLGTQGDNVRDARDKGRLRPWHRDIAHCQRGHPFDESNTIIRKGGRRRCRTCQAESERQYRQRKRAR